VRSPSWKKYALVVIFFALGLMSKPSLVTLPFLLLVLDVWPLERGRSGEAVRRLVWEKIPLVLLSLLSCVVTLWAQQGAIVDIKTWPFFWRLGNGVIAYVIYIGQTFYPWPLTAYYLLPGQAWPGPGVAAATLLLLAGSGAAWYWRRRFPWLAAGWAWYLGLLIPMIGLVQVGNQAWADRYTYLPQIGLLILMAWGGTEIFQNRRALVALSVALAGVWAALAWQQVGYWRNSETLWRHTLAHAAESAVVHNNLGSVLFHQNRLEEALEEGQAALRLDPQGVEVLNNLGLVYYRKKDFPAALRYYEKALKIRPQAAAILNNIGLIFSDQGQTAQAIRYFQAATQSRPDYAEAYCNLGSALAQEGRLAEAVLYLQRAWEIKPDSAVVLVRLGNLYAQMGEGDRAVAVFQKALELQPDLAQVWGNLGLIFFQQGRKAEAITHLEKALALQPDFVDAHLNLGVLFSQERRWAEAMKHYEQVLLLQPRDLDVRINLAVLFLQKGEPQEAIRYYREALKIAPQCVPALSELARILATHPDAKIRNGRQALDLAREADRLAQGRDPGILETLATAYAETGRFAEARATARRAIHWAQAQHNPALVAALQAELKSYEAGKPWRESGLAR
jgi:tetratricopeptide (TPR) repeat protein